MTHWSQAQWLSLGRGAALQVPSVPPAALAPLPPFPDPELELPPEPPPPPALPEPPEDEDEDEEEPPPVVLPVAPPVVEPCGVKATLCPSSTAASQPPEQ